VAYEQMDHLKEYFLMIDKVQLFLLVYATDALCHQSQSTLRCWILVTASCNIRIIVMLNCPTTLTCQPSMSSCLAPLTMVSTLSCTQVLSLRYASMHQNLLYYSLLFFWYVQLIKNKKKTNNNVCHLSGW